MFSYFLWPKGLTRLDAADYAEATRITVFVTVEPKIDEYYCHIDVWRGPTARAIHKAARKKYLGCYLGFGRSF